MNTFNTVSIGIKLIQIEDIYDGKLYKEHSRPNHILSFRENISLLWNTDGIPVFKSSTFSIWPIYFIINELPYKLRMCKQNCLLGGLWFGYTKPNMQLFLKPIWSVLSMLESTGIEVCATIDGVVRRMICRVILLGGTCDLPARSIVANFKQYNGFYGCAKCLQPGVTLSLGPKSHTHVYPFIESNPSGPLRSHKQTLEDVAHYMSTGTTRNGVLGQSWLGSL